VYAPSDPLFEVTIDGTNVVGPVTADQLRNGVAAGRVPEHAFVRLAGSYQQWVPLRQYPLPPPRPAPPSAQGWAAPPPSQQQPAPQPPLAATAPAPSAPDPQQAVALEQRIAELRKELESVEEAIDIQSFGFYRPRYDFGSAEQYVQKLKEVRERQKALLKSEKAAHCQTEWRVGGSVAEGKKMVQRLAKLMLRAFNGECDAAITKARYDNVVVLEQRLSKSFEEINALGSSNHVSITKEYFDQKLQELYLVHEHREQVQKEKEEQRRIKEQMREEQRGQEEIEKAKADAEKEEAQKAKALEKARAELLATHAETTAAQAQHTEKLKALVDKLENELKDAIDRKAKAMARAQFTRSGWVYVLSNLGSFGDGVFKIGMTRRLEPTDRVDELGDASVPFPFDVHAMIYADDAPKLENLLHRHFAARRVNMMNLRKEFFRVTLDEIREAVGQYHGVVSFVLAAEAEEWRKTQAKLEAGA
jgi:hypothetical protein